MLDGLALGKGCTIPMVRSFIPKVVDGVFAYSPGSGAVLFLIRRDGERGGAF